MRPKRRKPSVDAILGGAERVFARVGYGEASLRQLMAESSVSTTAFYARFDSKEAVLKELVLRLLREIGEQVAETLPGARDLPEGFRVGVDVLCDALVPRRDLVRIAEPKRVKIEDIQKIVAQHYNVSRSDILSSRRTATVVRPRQIAMYLAKTMTLRSLPEIGRRFGGRDHTTVLHAVRKIEGLVGQDPALSEEVEVLKRRLND